MNVNQGPERKMQLSTLTIITVTVVGWIITIMLAYGVVNARVAVLESRQGDSERRLQRMEEKLDRIWERIK